MIKISPKFVPEDPIDKSALVQVMTLYQTGDKALPEPIMTQINYADMHHLASMN